LSTTTIDVLRAAYPEGRFEVRRFRPNIVLQTPSKREDFIENGWADGALAIGSQLCLNVTGPCPRCVMTTLPQGDLPQDLGILKTAVRHNKGAVGAYPSVTKVGSTRRGDSVIFEPAISAEAVKKLPSVPCCPGGRPSGRLGFLLFGGLNQGQRLSG